MDTPIVIAQPDSELKGRISRWREAALVVGTTVGGSAVGFGLASLVGVHPSLSMMLTYVLTGTALGFLRGDFAAVREKMRQPKQPVLGDVEMIAPEPGASVEAGGVSLEQDAQPLGVHDGSDWTQPGSWRD